MATTSYQASPELRQRVFIARWFFTGIAIAMLVTSTTGFMPSLVHTAARRAPLSPLAADHGIVFFAWLLIFLVQSSLIASERVARHRNARPRLSFRPGVDDSFGLYNDCRDGATRLRSERRSKDRPRPALRIHLSVQQPGHLLCIGRSSTSLSAHARDPQTADA
jgi:hypothetical protein